MIETENSLSLEVVSATIDPVEFPIPATAEN
jgi:hypothetical protein